MLFSSAQLLFLFTLLLGTTLSVSSSSWFGAWIGLELNLLSFIPLVSSKNNQYSSEAALKYFLIQALGSSVIILSASIMLFSFYSSSILMTIALLLKAGVAPFHFWFPSVMEGLQWPQAIILMTVQKVAPMSLLSYLTFENVTPIFMSAIMLSAIIGALGGINQTLLRKIMAYSSINHMSWMLSAIMISESSWLFYFIMYSIISSSIALLFNLQDAFHISHVLNTINHSSQLKMMTFLSLLSLGGLPPFTGFIPKWFLIQEMVSAGLFLTLSVLLASALLTLYFYLRIAMTSLMISSPKTKWTKKSTLVTSITPSMLYLNLIGLLGPSLFMLLI
uniref:NADH-ubiquinone oxidoreductase chain 2 n=1 Tax=Hymenopenaeus neptunus TaxID=2291891 RepID=A0A345WJA5_9EUCA|nr:NADH dehydrogenase subunit 2 [Hymenopenaeus neptunus]AXJ93148.1 NADH dehydrogenase subunit 2 [Hymenopenaeus neptunus]